MLKSKIHFETTVEGEDFAFVCPTGCQTARAYQAADEFRSYLYGKLKEQEEAKQKAEQDDGSDKQQ